MTDLQKAKAAQKLMISEHNEAYEDGSSKWTSTKIDDGYYYGEHKMQERLTNQLEELNKCYFEGTGYKMVAVEPVQTKWNRKLDYGKATLKYKLVVE